MPTSYVCKVAKKHTPKGSMFSIMPGDLVAVGKYSDIWFEIIDQKCNVMFVTSPDLLSLIDNKDVFAMMLKGG